MSLNANYVATPKSPCVLVSAANTARDGSGANMVTLYTAPSSGARIDDISIDAIAATTAGMLRFFIHNTTSAFLVFEVPVTAVTPTASSKVFQVTLTNLGIVLQNGYSLRVTSHNAESFHICVTRGGDF